MIKRCPYCFEEIQDKAIVCRWCGKNLVNNVEKLAQQRIHSSGVSSESDASIITKELLDVLTQSVQDLSRNQEMAIENDVKNPNSMDYQMA